MKDGSSKYCVPEKTNRNIQETLATTSKIRQVHTKFTQKALKHKNHYTHYKFHIMRSKVGLGRIVYKNVSPKPTLFQASRSRKTRSPQADR